jgi:hypothetical protein
VLGVTGAVVPTLTFAFVVARSYAALTAVALAATVLEVVLVESVTEVTEATSSSESIQISPSLGLDGSDDW